MPRIKVNDLKKEKTLKTEEMTGVRGGSDFLNYTQYANSNTSMLAMVNKYVSDAIYGNMGKAALRGGGETGGGAGVRGGAALGRRDGRGRAYYGNCVYG